MIVLLVSQAAQDLAHLDGDFLIQRLAEVVSSAVSPFDRIANATGEVEALLAGERVWSLPGVGCFVQPFSDGVFPGVIHLEVEIAPVGFGLLLEGLPVRFASSVRLNGDLPNSVPIPQESMCIYGEDYEKITAANLLFSYNRNGQTMRPRNRLSNPSVNALVGVS